MEDTEIIELYWQRDQRAVDETHGKYGGFLTNIAWNILRSRSDAEECVNDTYLNAWNAIPPARPSALRAWLGRIARNLSLDRWRRDRTERRGGGMEVLLGELADCVPAPDSVQRTAEVRELSELISRWLWSLGEESRTLFVRRYWNGDSVKSLAQELGMQPNALTKRLLRLREGLRAYLESEGVAV